MTLQQHDRGVCKNLLMNFFMKFFSLKFCFQNIFYKKIIFFIKKNFDPHFPISCSHLFQDSFFPGGGLALLLYLVEVTLSRDLL